jgi:hypothetical protein
MRFDDIVEIVKEKKFLSENWVNRNYPDFHFFVSNLFVENILWKAKLYLYINDIKEVPVCYCGKLTKYDKGIYRKWCSTKCASSDPLVKEKRKRTNIDRYGYEIPLNNPEIKEKVINNWIDKFGVDNPSKSNIIKEKVKKTNFKNLGVEYPSQLESTKRILSQKMTNNRKWMSKCKIDSISDNLKNKVSSLDICFVKIKETSLYEFFCNKCELDFTIHKNMLNDRIRNKNTICTNCNKVSNMDSDGERTLYEFIKENYQGLIVRNDRSLGKELDIFLPNINLAIEFNGIYWHSEIYKGKYYHYEKSKICLENNINLIHIWEDDWLHKKNLVKMNLLNLLNGKKSIEIKEFFNNDELVIEIYDNQFLIGYLTCIIINDIFEISDLKTLYIYLEDIKRHILNKYKPKLIVIKHNMDWGFSEIYEDIGFKIIESNINYFKLINNIREYSNNDEYIGIYDSGYLKFELELN